MITGLRGTCIWSENLNNLLPFYRDVLGLEVTTETPGFVVLGGLWLGTHSEVHGRTADPARHMIGLTSRAGVPFSTEASRLRTIRTSRRIRRPRDPPHRTRLSGMRHRRWRPPAARPQWKWEMKCPRAERGRRRLASLARWVLGMGQEARGAPCRGQ